MHLVLRVGATVILAIIFVLLVNRAASSQQQVCADRDSIIMKAIEKFGEEPHSYGIAGGGEYMIELLVNRETGSWTVIGFTAMGRACVLASGTDWTVGEPLPWGTRDRPATEERVH